MTEVTERMGWNDGVNNYCLMEKRDRKWVFKEPLEKLQLRDMGSKAEFAEVLQMVNYKTTGEIDYQIGFDADYDKGLAIKLGCY